MHKIKIDKNIKVMIKNFRRYGAKFLVVFCLSSIMFVSISDAKSYDYIEKLPNGIILEKGRFINEKDRSEMAFISEGEFMMGDNEGNYNEKPEHKVYSNSYFIDVYEVTNAQFEKFVEETGYNPHGPWKKGYKYGERNYPVRFVTWHDASRYATWAGKRLPTEAEWEKAAKGKANYEYTWGNIWDEKFAEKTESFEPESIDSHPETISGYGCFGMAGGVWEWTLDWYDRFYYQNFDNGKIAIEPKGPQDEAKPEKRFLDTETAAGNERSALKVIRGGGNWGVFAKDNTRASKRMWGNPGYWFDDTGFRCVKVIK